MLTRFNAQNYKSGSSVTSKSYHNVSHAGPRDLYFGISEFNLIGPGVVFSVQMFHLLPTQVPFNSKLECKY